MRLCGAIRMGDAWVSYRKLDILGGLLSIPASISDFPVFHKMKQGDQQNLAMAGTATLPTWFKDQASIRTATQLLTLGDALACCPVLSPCFQVTKESNACAEMAPENHIFNG